MSGLCVDVKPGHCALTNSTAGLDVCRHVGGTVFRASNATCDLFDCALGSFSALESANTTNVTAFCLSKGSANGAPTQRGLSFISLGLLLLALTSLTLSASPV